MTAGWGEIEVLMDVSSRRLALVQHRHLPAHGLLSFLSFLRAFLLNVIKRNQAGLNRRLTQAEGTNFLNPNHRKMEFISRYQVCHE